MLVGSRLKIDLIALLTLETRNRICQNDFIRVTDMRDTSFGAVNIKGSCNPDPQYELMVKSDVSFGSVEIIYR